MPIPDALKRFPIVEAVYRVFCNFGRLNLPEIDPQKLANLSQDLIIPVAAPLSLDLDSPSPDLFFLLALAKTIQPTRILEVGTFRARTTCALKLNCPNAAVVSYDIAVIDSPYRRRLLAQHGVELRTGAFAGVGDKLISEAKFDLIFIDGSHLLADVLADSRLAAKLISDQGAIVWHDYRPNIPVTHRLRVPEALDLFSEESGRQIYHVAGTTCAIHSPSLRKEGTSRR
jgi:predicted O-methyltransferase YrrM